MERIELFDTVLIKRINKQGKTILKDPNDDRWLVSCDNENATEENEWGKALIVCPEADLQLVHKGSEEKEYSIQTVEELSPEVERIIKRVRSLSPEEGKEFLEFVFENRAGEAINLDQLS